MNFSISCDQFSRLPEFFNSKEEFVQASKNWARILNFYLSKDISSSERVTLRCVMGGRKKKTEERTRTIKCDCPFKLTSRLQKNGKWNAILTNKFHNHAPISSSSVSQGRALTENQRNEVLRLHECLVAPRQILAYLEVNHIVSHRDIYNIIATGKKKKLDGRSAIQCLLEDLQSENCFIKLEVDSENRVTHLFLAFEEQISMLKRHKCVLMADCTYKTNRYKMPLLHFTGLSNVGKSFSCAFCFMKSELICDYEWALNAWLDCFSESPSVIVTDHEDALISAASVVFPDTNQVLCIWHLNQNVLKNCKPVFSLIDPNQYDDFFSDFTSLVYLYSKEKFEFNYLQFLNTWSCFPRAITYIQRNVYPLKERFVAAWTSRYRHLGSVSTSRAEGLNGQIKRFIVSSREDLLGVGKALKLAVLSQLNEIGIMIEQQKIVNYHRFGEFFSSVKNKISVYALDMVLNQLKLERPLNECTNSFASIYGIPCGHALDQKIMFNEKLKEEDFCLHWKLFHHSENFTTNEFEAQVARIKRLVEIGGSNVSKALAVQLEKIGEFSSVNNPSVVASGRGRPTGSTSSSKRDPSGFEYVEAEAKKVIFQNKCESLCSSLEKYLRSWTYRDILEKAHEEGKILVGFSQSMCSLMKKGKSCVKNPETVEWLCDFLDKHK
jgi:hypothetical protein